MTATQISAAILARVADTGDITSSVDAVLGAGTFQAIAADVHTTLRTAAPRETDATAARRHLMDALDSLSKAALFVGQFNPAAQRQIHRVTDRAVGILDTLGND